jgi:hypothetical protein
MGVVVKFAYGFHPYLIGNPNYPIRDVTSNEGANYTHPETGEATSAEQLLGELVLRAHWIAWKSQDTYRNGFSLAEYAELVKDGEGTYTVWAAVEDPSLSLREQLELREVEVDPQSRITVVQSTRFMDYYGPITNFLIVKDQATGEVAIEIRIHTEPLEAYVASREKKYIPDFYFASDYAAGLTKLSETEKCIEAKREGRSVLIGVNPYLRDFIGEPQRQAKQMVFDINWNLP